MWRPSQRVLRFSLRAFLVVATLVILAVPLTFTLDLASFGAVLLVIGASTAPMVNSEAPAEA